MDQFWVLSNQCSIAFNPNSCALLVYKLVTPNVTSFEFFVKFLLHFLRTSIYYQIILDKRGLKRISTRSVRRLVEICDILL